MDGIEPAADLVVHLPVSRRRSARRAGLGAAPGPARRADPRAASGAASGAAHGTARGAAPAPATGRRLIDHPGDVAAAAASLATGALVGHPFANIYVLTTRPDAGTVRSVNLLAGRPPRQIGSVVSTPMRLPLLLDWTRLPLAAHQVLGLLDALLGLGPIGVRGPASPAVPSHLAQVQAGIPTVQVLSPGHACPSTDFLARALHAAGSDLLAVTATGRGGQPAVAGEEPAHWRAAGLRADFGDVPDFLLLEHRDERQAQERYPAFAPVAPTVLSLPTVLSAGTGRRPRLVLERHGSLPADRAREVVDGFGFDLALRGHAWQPLSPRHYGAVGA